MEKAIGKVASAKNNGGFHKLSAYRKAEKMIREHQYKAARLYHLCFVDAKTKKPYLAAMKALAEHLRKNSIECEYHAALEDKAGNLHLHVYLLVEAALNNPDHILNRKSGGWLDLLCLRKHIDFHINAPGNPMHGGKNYASVPKTKPEKVEDCCLWIQYIFKMRDKPAEGQVYFASRPGRRRQPTEDKEAA